jgi:hypothetical protein
LLGVVLLSIGWSFVEEGMDGLINPPIPKADKLYFAFLVDASSRMADPFDGGRTKWDAVREAALDNLIFGLPSRANYGLILLGGNSGGQTSNCEQVEMAYSFRPDSRSSVETLIQSQQPRGVTSLAKAIDLARDQLLKLSDDESTVKDVELFVFLGGGDGCLNDDYRPLLFFLQNSARFLSKTHIDIFVLSKEPIDPAIEEAIKESDQQTEAVRVNITRNQPELETAVEQSSLDAKERAREVEPTAVAFQETIAVQTLIFTPALATDVPPNTVIAATNHPTSIEVSFTPSLAPTITASVTASQTPQPSPTQVPPTPIPPTEEPSTQPPPTPIPTQAVTYEFYSSDGIYGVNHLYLSDSLVHCQVFETSTNRLILTTSAKYSSDNDVKNCNFGAGNSKFAAAYHYGDNGDYTWIGVWSLPQGDFLYPWEKPGHTDDLSGVFDGPQ